MKTIIITKNPITTNLMQSAGVFEKDKFIGWVSQFTFSKTIPPKQLFDILIVTAKRENFTNSEIVGCIILNEDYYILPEHKVISDGYKWSLISDIIKGSNCKELTTV